MELLEDQISQHVDELAGYLGLQRVSERLQCDEIIAHVYRLAGYTLIWSQKAMGEYSSQEKHVSSS